MINRVMMPAVAALTTPALAGIGVDLLETSAPPTVLHGLPMTAAVLDQRPIFADVVDARLDAAGDCTVTFDGAMTHYRIGIGWPTWTHGYLGDAYYTNGRGAARLTFDPADQIDRFILYVEPNSISATFTLTGTADTGETVAGSAFVEYSGGARGWAFRTDTGNVLTSITIENDVFGGGIDFAFGEFSYHKVPAPSVFGVIAAWPVLAGRRRRC